MYTEKQWLDHVTEFEDRYTEQDNGDGTITHIPVEGEVLQEEIGRASCRERGLVTV